MSTNRWGLVPPSWWPSRWWPFKLVSSWNVSFYNGLKAVARYPAQSQDVRLAIAGRIYGIETVIATNNKDGAIRIKVNGVVRSIVHT